MVEPEGSGSLNLFSMQVSRVYDQGTLLGETPLVSRTISAGRHSLRIVRVDGGGEQTLHLDVAPGEDVRHTIDW